MQYLTCDEICAELINRINEIIPLRFVPVFFAFLHDRTESVVAAVNVIINVGALSYVYDSIIQAVIIDPLNIPLSVKLCVFLLNH